MLFSRKGRDKRQLNSGSAMIVAIVVSIVLMVFALSLLLVSYSLFSSTANQNTQTKCRELAKSVSLEIREELTTPSYSNYDEQKKDILDGKNPLWSYIRCNLWQSNWPYYNESETGHKAANSYKYYKLDAGDLNGMAGQVTVTMYWEIESADPSVETNRSLTKLHVIVKAENDQSSYEAESVYALNCASFVDSTEGEVDTVSSSSANPQNNSIYKNENWKWDLE